MARAGIWTLGIAVSAVAHLGMGAGLMAALQPQEIPDQPNPKSKLQVTPEVVDRKDAEQRTPDSTDVTGQQTSGAALGAGAVATSDAIATALPTAKASAADPSAAQASAQPVAAAKISAALSDIALAPLIPPQASTERPKAITAAAAIAADPNTTPAIAAVPAALTSAAAPVAATPAAPARPPARSAVSVTLAAVAAQPVGATVTPAALAVPIAQSATPATLAAAPALSVKPTAPTADATPPASAAAPATQPDAAPAVASAHDPDIAPAQAPVPVALSQSTPQVTATKAVLAFPDAGTGTVDPASLAAFQSFTQPGEAGTNRVRDDLASLLSLPCARMQVSFDPDTTTLQLSGHVPRPDQRAPLVAALQAQMGADIEVTDNLLVLPAPQCGALSGIANVGLPQSTDQITNPLIVGKDTHARSFRYIKNDPMVLDLVGPDYPAYVYVDYFDADGNVIHLSPNAQTPLIFANPKEQISIGARRPGDPGLMVIIGPPYGQEIAVAFAASAPLYAEQRPIVEPAQPYLDWLEGQVADARAADPEFKGEWVYFFVQTAEE